MQITSKQQEKIVLELLLKNGIKPLYKSKSFDT